MWEKERIRRMMQRSSLLVAYLALAAGCVAAFLFMVGVTDRIEREALVRSYDNCVASNETREIIGLVLDGLVAPRDDDAEGAFEERRELRRMFDDLLAPQDCPPNPSSPEFIEHGEMP